MSYWRFVSNRRVYLQVTVDQVVEKNFHSRPLLRCSSVSFMVFCSGSVGPSVSHRLSVEIVSLHILVLIEVALLAQEQIIIFRMQSQVRSNFLRLF
jgi:hypothetical protein